MRFSADYDDTSSNEGDHPASTGPTPSAPRPPPNDPPTDPRPPTATQWNRLIGLHRTLRRTMKDMEKTLLELPRLYLGERAERFLGSGQVDTPLVTSMMEDFEEQDEGQKANRWWNKWCAYLCCCKTRRRAGYKSMV